jgi:hypothetical protein
MVEAQRKRRREKAGKRIKLCVWCSQRMVRTHVLKW